MIQFDEHIFQMGWFNHQPDEEFRAAVRSGEDAALEALLKKGIDPNLPGQNLRSKCSPLNIWRIMALMTWIRG